MVKKVFLTEARREVLADEFEGEDSTRGSHKSRIRTRARMALNELIEVAESDEIANEDVFDPRLIRRLLFAVFGDYEAIEPYSEAWEEDGMGPQAYLEKYDYETSVAEAINHIDTVYGGLLLDSEPPRSGKESVSEAELHQAADTKEKKVYIDVLKELGWEVVEGSPEPKTVENER